MLLNRGGGIAKGIIDYIVQRNAQKPPLLGFSFLAKEAALLKEQDGARPVAGQLGRRAATGKGSISCSILTSELTDGKPALARAVGIIFGAILLLLSAVTTAGIFRDLCAGRV